MKAPLGTCQSPANGREIDDEEQHVRDGPASAAVHEGMDHTRSNASKIHRSDDDDRAV